MGSLANESLELHITNLGYYVNRTRKPHQPPLLNTRALVGALLEIFYQEKINFEHVSYSLLFYISILLLVFIMLFIKL